MANQDHDNLRKIEKLVVKLRNKMKRADLDYLVQISIDSTQPAHINYAASITSPAKGLAPVAWVKDSAEELIEAVKLATKGIDYDAIEKAYHEAQIEACKRTILGHEERIKEMEEEAKEAKKDKK